jgi:outer membrane protein W
MHFGILLLLAMQSFPGNGHVQPTSAYLRLAPSLGPAMAADLQLGDKRALQLAANEARPRASIRGENGAEGRRIRVVPLSFSLLQRFGASARVQPYAGAGLAFPFVRRANDVVDAPAMHVTRIEQPDHVAVIAQLGARVPLSGRWWAAVDAKVFPFESTFETHRAEYPRDGLQTNFHPLIVTTGVGVRF